MHLATRPPLARILMIDKALRAGARPNASTLARDLEVNPKTIQRDINYMRDQLHAPLEFDRVRHGYYYTEPGFSLPYVRLTEGELVALFLAERLLRQYRGTPYEQDLQRAFAKVTELLPEAISVNLTSVAETLSVTPTVLTVHDIQTFQALSTAVLHRQRLEMEYWTASRNELTHRAVDPYHLTLIDTDWYLIGYCHLRHEVRMFSPLRVRSIRETGETFDRPGDFRVESYLSGSFRAVRGDAHHQVVLRFTPSSAGRIAEKLWHSSQTSERTADGGLVLRFQVSDLREVKRWVLSQGSDCVAEGPERLRTAIRAELATMANAYQPRRPANIKQPNALRNHGLGPPNV